MSEKLKALLGLLILVLLSLGVYWVLSTIADLAMDFFSRANPTLQTGIVAAATTITVSVVSIVLGKAYERRLDSAKVLREANGPTYEEFLEFMFTILNSKGKMDEEELMARFVKFNRRLLLWGRNDAVKAWGRFRLTAGKQDGFTTLDTFADLINAIRREYGHRRLNRADILRTFVNDYDEQVAKRQ